LGRTDNLDCNHRTGEGTLTGNVSYCDQT
jgi:hypothetical protein